MCVLFVLVCFIKGWKKLHVLFSRVFCEKSTEHATLEKDEDEKKKRKTKKEMPTARLI